MKLGFPIDVRPRLSSLRKFIVSSDTCFGTHCAFSTSHASPNPRACITSLDLISIEGRYLMGKFGDSHLAFIFYHL